MVLPFAQSIGAEDADVFKAFDTRLIFHFDSFLGVMFILQARRTACSLLSASVIEEK
jgi:hypothetical protein